MSRFLFVPAGDAYPTVTLRIDADARTVECDCSGSVPCPLCDPLPVDKRGTLATRS
jgi:hypothetical protein